MKTITITFSQDNCEIGSVTGEFEGLPGSGRLSWARGEEIERMLAFPYKAPLPKEHYAETFQTAMLGLAAHHKWHAQVSAAGEWREYRQAEFSSHGSEPEAQEEKPVEM